MGANSREFLRLRMAEQDYAELSSDVRHKMEVELVKVKNFNYSGDDLWCKLSKESRKAYKKLKDREYELRHNPDYVEPLNEENT